MSTLIERLGLAALHSLDPETAHGLAMWTLQTPLVAAPGPITSDRLRANVAGLELPNPVGLAAGFDKNATATAPLSRAGFGFIEVGAATPLPQPGNPKPRLFRLTEDRAAINRFGFNNEGAEVICARLAKRGAGVPVGLNLGANKTSTDRAADFAKVMIAARDHVDFATVNVSSPNTEKLRDLQGKAALAGLLEGVMEVRGETPVFLKIAPDLNAAEITDVAEVATQAGVAAIIATNTTLDRAGLRSTDASETGGLSGAPLFEKSTRVLAQLSTMTDIPLIGVGGIGSAEQAYAKICAGASAVQLYTALVYGGLSLAAEIARGLDKLLAKDGFANVADAMGSKRKDLAVNKTADVTAKNKAAWDASAVHHGTGAYWEDLRRGFADPSYSRFDATMAKALTTSGIKGAKAVQIGCNNGREVLSACALGAAHCLGIDQSAGFLAQAKALHDISGHSAAFLEADIYNLPPDCPTGFDIAFVTIGVLNWMPDLPGFFRAAASLLRPGGRLVIYETHPVLEMFDPEAPNPMRPTFSYFRADPFIETAAITYDGSSHGDMPESHWFIHTLGAIVQANLDAGLTLTGLSEFSHSIREVDYDIYEDQEAQLPMSFLMTAIKPG